MAISACAFQDATLRSPAYGKLGGPERGRPLVVQSLPVIVPEGRASVLEPALGLRSWLSTPFGVSHCKSVRQGRSLAPRIASAVARLELRAAKGTCHQGVPRDKERDGSLLDLHADVRQSLLEVRGLLLVL